MNSSGLIYSGWLPAKLKQNVHIRMRLWNIKPQLQAMGWFSGIKTGRKVKFRRIIPADKG